MATGRAPAKAVQKEAVHLYGGTALDPKERIRKRVLKAAQKFAAKKTSKKSTSSSDLGSSSSSTSTGDDWCGRGLCGGHQDTSTGGQVPGITGNGDADDDDDEKEPSSHCGRREGSNQRNRLHTSTSGMCYRQEGQRSPGAGTSQLFLRIRCSAEVTPGTGARYPLPTPQSSRGSAGRHKLGCGAEVGILPMRYPSPREGSCKLPIGSLT